LNVLAVVMRAVYKDLLLLTMEDRLLDYGELRKRVSCICETACVCYQSINQSEIFRVVPNHFRKHCWWGKVYQSSIMWGKEKENR